MRRLQTPKTRYAFYFDSSACSGCKACQVACKDKHNLPAGILWRRVYEVIGGGWTRRANAWVSDVFAYNLSLSCNHCDRPICVEICPARAIMRRADGIVLIDERKCLGCRYCSWACPYNALQYDNAAGRMTKCNLCVDQVDKGLPPTCVAACPLRSLELKSGELHNSTSTVFPLPDRNLTMPAIAIKPHPQASRASRDTALIDSLGQVSAQRQDYSLIAFTILAQLSVGAFWVLGALSLGEAAEELSRRISLFGAVAMLLAVIASLFHLGTPANAWRALSNLRSSWLSREILFSLSFGTASLLSAGMMVSGLDGRITAIGLAAILGLGLVVSMARVYRLRTVNAWNTKLTLAAFLTTTLLLGVTSVGGAAIWLGEPRGAISWVALWVSGLIVVEWVISWLWQARPGTGAALNLQVTKRPAARLNRVALSRLLLQLASIGVIAAGLFGINERAAVALGFVLVLASEVLGRCMFYDDRTFL